MRLWTFATVLLLCGGTTVSAQTEPVRFRWQTGQVLTYKVEHITSATHTVKDMKLQTSSKLHLLKRWQVLAVDDSGVATLQFTLAAMRNEQTQFNGEVLLFDSAQPDKSTPALKEHLLPFIGKPLAVLRVDATGRVIEAKVGSLSRYEAEPPFLLTLPTASLTVGQNWQRNYTLTLDPPQGTGEEYAAVQTCTCQSMAGPLATIALKTDFKSMPESPQDRLPLFQKQPAGEIVFDIQNGRIQRARLTIHKELQNQQGAGSSYRFDSTYTEEYVPAEGSKK